jgi:hypothetical protein
VFNDQPLDSNRYAAAFGDPTPSLSGARSLDNGAGTSAKYIAPTFREVTAVAATDMCSVADCGDSSILAVDS